MIRFVRAHPLLSGVASAAIVSSGLLIWLATTVGTSPDSASDSEAVVVTSSTESTDQGQTPTGPDTEAEPDPTAGTEWPNEASQSEQAALADQVNPALARLTYAERVDSVASVNAGGKRWILSELPTDTRNRLVDEGLAGPDLDPFGGEILLVEDDVILRAFPMNEFPPTFLETDGVMVFGGRNGDGGYPDSALVGINALTLESTWIALRPPGSDSVAAYGPHWLMGTAQQLSDLVDRNYLRAIGAMSGTLVDGDEWVVKSDPTRGLCAAISDINYGCDDESVFISPADPPYTPRILAMPVPPEGIDHNEIGVIVYGYLPAGATDVEIRVNGVPLGFDAIVEEVIGMWVVPAAVPNEPFSVVFLDESLLVVTEWTGE